MKYRTTPYSAFGNRPEQPADVSAAEYFADDEEIAGHWYSCPYCAKTKPEPFHCMACNYDAEAT